MWHDSVCNTVQEPTVTSTIIAKKTAAWRESGFPSEFLESTLHLTSDEALRLPQQPKRMAIMGGGYIAAELAHFFGSLGTEVTLIHRRSTMLREEEDEIAQRFT